MKRIIPVGKLPNEVLLSILRDMSADDQSLVVGPGVGEDAAILDIEKDSFIVVAADPITFTTGRMGFYSITVNANDIAVSGATPRWFFPILLFPPETDEAQVRQTFSEIESAASAIGATVSGGHTEITTAVNRPVVSGTMIGVVRKNRLKRTSSIQPGDSIVMTKTAGNEGTAILAKDFAERLTEKGLTPQELDTAAGFLDRLSILPEARTGAGLPAVRAMHDVTEGGVATALFELSAASGCGIEIHLDAIPIEPVTERICRALNLDPLGLIGSGSLLTVIAEAAANKYVHTLKKKGIPAAMIGTVTGRGTEAVAISKDARVDFPQFDADEIAKMFS